MGNLCTEIKATVRKGNKLFTNMCIYETVNHSTLWEERVGDMGRGGIRNHYFSSDVFL